MKELKKKFFASLLVLLSVLSERWSEFTQITDPFLFSSFECGWISTASLTMQLHMLGPWLVCLYPGEPYCNLLMPTSLAGQPFVAWMLIMAPHTACLLLGVHVSACIWHVGAAMALKESTSFAGQWIGDLPGGDNSPYSYFLPSHCRTTTFGISVGQLSHWNSEERGNLAFTWAALKANHAFITSISVLKTIGAANDSACEPRVFSSFFIVVMPRLAQTGVRYAYTCCSEWWRVNKSYAVLVRISCRPSRPCYQLKK
jgi:hypothetical protein